jgi:hypothetical protein
MDAKACTRKARNNISSDLKHQLALESNFACSICGKIPIVFHHIEEWSKEYSNDYSVLIPICDLCHRRIHGEGGNLFSKSELYEHKKNPKRPLLLKDTLPLDSKSSYSFFLGSNFIADGSKANLFGLPGGNHLTTIDVSGGNLKLSILEKIVDGEKFYLIKENELMIDTTDIWDMKYSGNSLKIWKNTDGRKNIFMDLIIRPALIIIKRMETAFNGRSFRIYKYRAPHKNKVAKLQKIIQSYEVKYKEISEEIDALPRKYENLNNFELDSFIKQNQKDGIKRQCEQAILYGHQKEFKWEWPYYYKVVHKLFEDSKIFHSRQNITAPLSKEHERINMRISKIKEEYGKDFEALEDTVAEYGGMILDGTIMI